MRILMILALSGLATGLRAQAEETATPGLKVTAKPLSLQITRTRYFEATRIQSCPFDGMRLSVELSCEPPVQLAGWGDIVVTEAVTDAGEDVRQPGLGPGMPVRRPFRGSDHSGRSFSFSRQRGGRVRLDLSLKPPTKPCTRIRSLTGSVSLLVRASDTTRVELKPLREFLGKPLEVPGMTGAVIIVERDTARPGFTVTMPEKWEAETQGVEFYTAAGERVDWSGGGFVRSDDRASRSYTVDLPDSGTMVVLVYPEPVQTPVKFTVENVLMPGAEEPAAPAKK